MTKPKSETIRRRLEHERRIRERDSAFNVGDLTNLSGSEPCPSPSTPPSLDTLLQERRGHDGGTKSRPASRLGQRPGPGSLEKGIIK